jgi:hypothetical protein
MRSEAGPQMLDVRRASSNDQKHLDDKGKASANPGNPFLLCIVPHELVVPTSVVEMMAKSESEADDEGAYHEGGSFPMHASLRSGGAETPLVRARGGVPRAMAHEPGIQNSMGREFWCHDRSESKNTAPLRPRGPVCC